MVFTAAQTTSFFTDDDQMALDAATYAQIQVEGIQSVSDLAEFDDDTFKLLADNLRGPGGTVPDPNGGGVQVPTPPFVFGVKSQIGLKAAANLVRYYATVGRDPSWANMMFEPYVKHFNVQWKSLKERKEELEPDVPKITRALPIMKWTESFSDFLHRVVGNRTIPLVYVIRENVDVPAAAPALAQGHPYLTETGLVQNELVSRASHTHPLFEDDNADVYYKLEEATRGTQYTSSIKPFQRTKNGRGAWEALPKQYASKDKWDAELKRQDELLHNRKWKGQGNLSLDRFVSLHCNAFVSMRQCSEHVQFQLPNEFTRVGDLLDAIKCSDAPLQAAMALIKNDMADTGKRNNFEDAAAFLLPHCPVAKKRQTKRPHGGISAADTTIKSGLGKTGVELRYHTKVEYEKLSEAQQQELRKWRKQERKVNPDLFKKVKKGKTEATIQEEDQGHDCIGGGSCSQTA